MQKLKTGKRKKHSGKRDAILKTLLSTSAHPGAQWVYNKLKPVIPDLSIGTVYRNIRYFINEGLAICVDVVNGEERFDAVVKPHPHFVCCSCGEIIDLPDFDCKKLKASTKNNFSFTIDYRNTIFKGVCKNCENKGL